MKLYLRQRLQAGVALVCTLAIVCFTVPVFAEDSAALSKKTNALQSELDGINKDMLSVSKEIESIQMQSEVMSGEILRTQDSLDKAQKNEDKQYQDMKVRIKYLYETGNSSLLELLFSAKDMADFLNKADFIQNVSDYDRDMLDKLRDIRKEVAAKEATLKAQKGALGELKTKLTAQQAELKKKAESTSTDLAAYQARLQQVRAQETAAASKFVTSTDGSTVKTDAVKVTDNEKKLLASIIECESYQDYNSLLAVATVIMNRVGDPRFPNTIAEVVYASNQFEPVTLGSLDAVLAKGPSALSMQVAEDALNGKRLAAVADCYYFLYAGATDKGGVNVGDNVFFQSW